MHMDTNFGRPRDPVMDQVADILKGILSNLTKHRSLVAIADAVSKSDLSAEQRALVVDDLERQVKKLNAGGESFALDAYLAEHPADKEAPKISEKLKTAFDKKWGPFWHVCVGKNFGCHAVHEKRRFVYFYIGQHAFMLYKAQ